MGDDSEEGLLQITCTSEKLLRLEMFPTLYDGVNLKKKKGVLDDPNYKFAIDFQSHLEEV